MSANITIIGTLQDGGYPHPGCELKCCSGVIEKNRYVSCLSIVDSNTKEYWLIDITPDFRQQSKLIQNSVDSLLPSGIFLTHAHSGHYTGLLELGREVMNTSKIPVYVMSKMKLFLENNDPWKQLVHQGNIKLIQLKSEEEFSLNALVSINPFLVPHRGEISETAGFKIKGHSKSIIYIPDIDSWEDWEMDIKEVIKENQILFIDGTFYHDDEIQGRNLNEIPHPRIIDTMDLLKNLNDEDRSKVYFTHLNHTNNALRSESNEYKSITENGFKIATEGIKIIL